jgi:FkbM family methyltransferase
MGTSCLSEFWGLNVGFKSLLEGLGIMRDRCIRDHFVVHRDDLYRVWEETHLQKLLHLLQVDCVFDVGANSGQYGEMLRTRANYAGRIVSFEPNPEAFEAAKTKASGFKDWSVESIALSTADSRQKFNIMHGSEFSSLSAPDHRSSRLFERENSVAKSIVVPTETLQTAFVRLQAKYGFQRPFLKLDTQGFDVAIVEAGSLVMKRFVGMQSELSMTKLYETSVDFRDAISKYQSCGFELSAIVPNNSGHFPRLIEMDCIMIRKDLLGPSVPQG